MKRLFALILSAALMLSCTACGNTPNNTDVIPANESSNSFKNGLETSTPDSMTKIDGYLYYCCDGFLNYINPKTKQSKVLCGKPNCRHEEGDTACNGYVGLGEHLFSQNDYLYLVSLDNSGNNVLQKYAKDGTFIGNQTTLPEGLQHLICHNGVIYYTYYEIPEETDTSSMDWSFPAPILASCDLENGKKTVLYQGKYNSGYLGNIFALGDKLFLIESIWDKGDVTDSEQPNLAYRIYDILTAEFSLLIPEDGVISQKILPFGDRLLLNNYTGDAEQDKTCYIADIDGPIWKKYQAIEYPLGITVGDGDLLITDNQNMTVDNYSEMESRLPEPEISVYCDEKKILTFDFSDLDGNDCSHTTYFRFISADSYVILAIGSDYSQMYGFNKTDLEKGEFFPFRIGC